VYTTKGKTLEVHLSNGISIEGLAPHKLWVLRGTEFKFVRLDKLKPNDALLRTGGTGLFGSYTSLKHLNDLTIVFSEIRRLMQADNNLSKHLQKEINLYYLFEIYHRYLPAMYSNIKRVDLIKGLARLSQNCIPPILETRLTFKSIKRFLFLKLPFSIQYLIKSHKYKKDKT
jgi:hypothetical protein